MPYRVRAIEDQRLWVVYAPDAATAELISKLFRQEGYLNVEVQQMPED